MHKQHTARAEDMTVSSCVLHVKIFLLKHVELVVKIEHRFTPVRRLQIQERTTLARVLDVVEEANLSEGRASLVALHEDNIHRVENRV